MRVSISLDYVRQAYALAANITDNCIVVFDDDMQGIEIRRVDDDFPLVVNEDYKDKDYNFHGYREVDVLKAFLKSFSKTTSQRFCDHVINRLSKLQR